MSSPEPSPVDPSASASSTPNPPPFSNVFHSILSLLNNPPEPNSTEPLNNRRFLKNRIIRFAENVLTDMPTPESTPSEDGVPWAPQWPPLILNNDTQLLNCIRGIMSQMMEHYPVWRFWWSIVSIAALHIQQTLIQQQYNLDLGPNVDLDIFGPNEPTNNAERRQIPKRTYGPADLQMAIQAVQQKVAGTRKASQMYGVPRSTLRNKISKCKLQSGDGRLFSPEGSPMLDSLKPESADEDADEMKPPTLVPNLNTLLYSPDGEISEAFLWSSETFAELSPLQMAFLDSKPLPREKRGQYKKYNAATLEDAVKAVQNGEMSVHKAGSHYGVPHSTLEYKVKERKRKGDMGIINGSQPNDPEKKPKIDEGIETSIHNPIDEL